MTPALMADVTSAMTSAMTSAGATQWISPSLYSQLLGGCAGIELLATVLLVWRGALVAAARMLALQGIGLAGLVTVIGLDEQAPELLAVAALVLLLKGWLLPRLLARSGTRADRSSEDGRPAEGAASEGSASEGAAAGAAPDQDRSARPDPTPSLLAVAALATLAYLVSRPVVALVPGPAGRAVPVGVVLVLCGFLVLVTRRRAHTQLVGFLMLDNGIATVAFLTAGGVPLVVELGVSLDVLLVVLVLQVLSGRMRLAFGSSDLDDLKELRD